MYNKLFVIFVNLFGSRNKILEINEKFSTEVEKSNS